MTALQHRPAKPARKPKSRSVCLARVPREGKAGLLRITVGGRADVYQLVVLASDFSDAVASFRLFKQTIEPGDEEATYDVLFTKDAASCDCRGHTAHHHCKHVDSLAALIQRGKLPLAAGNEHLQGYGPDGEFVGVVE